MSSWLSRILETARRDKNLAKKLREIAELDSKLMPKLIRLNEPTLNRMGSREYRQMMQRSSNLCDEAARAIASPGEDADEIALWISYNCQKIVRQLPRRRWPW